MEIPPPDVTIEVTEWQRWSLNRGIQEEVMTEDLRICVEVLE